MKTETSAPPEPARYNDTVSCEQIWETAEDIHRSENETRCETCRDVLLAGFGSAAAAGGHILFEVADLCMRIDAHQGVSRKQKARFEEELRKLSNRAQIFSGCTSYSERKEVFDIWKQEKNGDILLEADTTFSVAASIAAEALEAATARTRRASMSKTMERTAWHLEPPPRLD